MQAISNYGLINLYANYGYEPVVLVDENLIRFHIITVETLHWLTIKRSVILTATKSWLAFACVRANCVVATCIIMTTVGITDALVYI